jgi:hypothetical protein
LDDYVEIADLHSTPEVVAPVHPLVMMLCSTCGNTLLFNATMMGLLQEPVSKDAGTDRKPGGGSNG